MNNDPRSLRGILSRGANVYNGVGMSSKVGMSTPLSAMSASMRRGMNPPSMRKPNYQDVAQKMLRGM